jgi:hypothetical protein
MYSDVMTIIGLVGALGIPAFLTMLVERLWYPHRIGAGISPFFGGARTYPRCSGATGRRQRQYHARLPNPYSQVLQFRH